MASIDELKRSIAELEERNREARIDRGLPETPPEPFVPLPLSIVLAERLLPFKNIAVKYFALIAEGTYHRLDTSKLADYRRDAEILRMSVGDNCAFIGGGIVTLIRYMDEITGEMDNADVIKILRVVPLTLNLMDRQDIWADAYDIRSDVPPVEQDRLMREQIAQLEFQAEYDAARTYYDTIKHLI